MPFLGNIGGGEMLIIGIVLFLFFGGKKMNDIAKGLGQSSKELKNIKNEFEQAVKETQDPQIGIETETAMETKKKIKSEEKKTNG